ncbi:VOC family protein [Saccharopolyspora sp. HNM0983]|uniref:VOC family protein n=1 Tax=Saccharopolyspora montiporae TaxID=2781240 RepID=A0A929BAK4_9PSEU|nr:VOC family protein [Saccharopolyspora sp. HNM0983]MBE9374845.1 VOC family protein [Saccharopolyspora sp. HNM0983]
MAPRRLAAYVLDCPDPRALADFYGRLLDWAVDESASDADWVELADPAGGAPLSFQRDPGHRRPTWPGRELPQMAHLDIRVSTLQEGAELALAAGAVPLEQPAGQLDANFRVYADPAGHPFCMCACAE